MGRGEIPTESQQKESKIQGYDEIWHFGFLCRVIEIKGRGSLTGGQISRRDEE
jgi:hypothetical protein